MLVFLISTISALVVSLTIYFRNPKGALHRYYLLFTVSIIFWLTGVLLEKTPESFFELHFRLLFTPALLMTIFLLLFIHELAGSKFRRPTLLVVYSVSLFISLASIFTPWITRTVEITQGGVILPERGPLYLPSTMWILGIGLASIYFLSLSIQRNKHDSKKRRQAKVVVVGLVFAVITASMTNIILPYLTGSTSYSNLAPFSLIFLSFGLGYAIVKHRLFDIRATIARTVAYVASITLMVVIFIASVATLSQTTLFSSSLELQTRIAYIALAVLAAITFQPLKKMFDRLTNRIFYRDAYDSQGLLQDLNNTLVNATELEVLLTKSALIVQEKMKASYCTIYIRETGYFKERIFVIR